MSARGPKDGLGDPMVRPTSRGHPSHCLLSEIPSIGPSYGYMGSGAKLCQFFPICGPMDPLASL